MAGPMDELYRTLHVRRRPEDVAEMVRTLPGLGLNRAEVATLDRAASLSVRRGLANATSMLEDFARPVPPERQVRKALELFRRAGEWTAAECASPERVDSLIRDLCPLVGKTFGASDFKTDRLSAARRAAAGFDLSRRRYNKLFRLLARLEAKLQTYSRELRKADFVRVGKTRLATRLPEAEFRRDPPTAAFVAYYAARCALRSVFTNAAQDRPYDEIAAMLFARLEARPSATNWWAVAFVYPAPAVVARLSGAQKGELLGRWLVLLRDIAALLREFWQSGGIDRATMIVARGNDSTTWNNAASAWNRARDAYIALMQSLGLRRELNAMLPGKVLRLMASDVAAWHRASGGGLAPDTAVWAELPPPWDVLAGDADCPRRLVIEVCPGTVSRRSSAAGSPRVLRARGQTSARRPNSSTAWR